MSDTNEGREFEIEVKSTEEMQVAIFKAIDATIETLRKTDLHSGSVYFEYDGAKITVGIET